MEIQFSFLLYITTYYPFQRHSVRYILEMTIKELCYHGKVADLLLGKDLRCVQTLTYE